MGKGGRLNLTLTPKLDQRLNKYILGVVNRQGKIPHAITTKIIRQALEEWLDNHENDFNIIK